MSKSLSALCVICALVNPNARAFERQKVQVGVSEIPYSLSQYQDKRGDYNRLLDQISELEVIFMPPARAGRMFDKKQIDCLFPASTATMKVAFQVIQSSPITSVSAFVFSQSPYDSIASFKGKKIALRRGFSFGNVREKLDANYIELESESRAIQFLLKGRVDGVIGYRLDVENAEKELEVSGLFFDSSNPLYSAQEAFVCHATGANRDLFDRINPIIEAFK